MTKKLTDKQKIRLWEQQRLRCFQESCRLEIPDTGRAPEPEGNALGDEALVLTMERLATLELGPILRGLPWLCVIHRHLFTGLFEHAGELRQVDISLGDTPFCHFAWIEKEGNALMQKLENERYLSGLDRRTFVMRLAWYYGEINVLHPFRFGSGRTQRIFFEQMAIHAGYCLDWRPVTPQAWRDACQSGAMGDPVPLESLFDTIVSAAGENA
ncbi:putative adenosine monophosphate-protein transferase Fic [Erwinia sp. CPCC 100877]|nr:putative adenosine monophosphate-protein transferase Fic [Erwinia sp. CPCC 100877]